MRLGRHTASAGPSRTEAGLSRTSAGLSRSPSGRATRSGQGHPTASQPSAVPAAKGPETEQSFTAAPRHSWSVAASSRVVEMRREARPGLPGLPGLPCHTGRPPGGEPVAPWAVAWALIWTLLWAARRAEPDRTQRRWPGRAPAAAVSPAGVSAHGRP